MGIFRVSLEFCVCQRGEYKAKTQASMKDASYSELENDADQWPDLRGRPVVMVPMMAAIVQDACPEPPTPAWR